jgi:hypothetical protein
MILVPLSPGGIGVYVGGLLLCPTHPSDDYQGSKTYTRIPRRLLWIVYGCRRPTPPHPNPPPNFLT